MCPSPRHRLGLFSYPDWFTQRTRLAAVSGFFHAKTPHCANSRGRGRTWRFDMVKRTRNNLNPNRIPNVAKYRDLAARAGTWSRMVNSTDFSGDDGCWNWKSTTNDNGYGIFTHHEMGRVLAHRLALHVAGKPVPEHLTVDHLCRNRKCVNPSHLEMVPVAVNVLRGESQGGINARKTHCKHGHKFTPGNTYIGKSRTNTGTPTRTCRTCTLQRAAKKRSLVSQ